MERRRGRGGERSAERRAARLSLSPTSLWSIGWTAGTVLCPACTHSALSRPPPPPTRPSSTSTPPRPPTSPLASPLLAHQPSPGYKGRPDCVQIIPRLVRRDYSHRRPLRTSPASSPSRSAFLQHRLTFRAASLRRARPSSSGIGGRALGSSSATSRPGTGSATRRASRTRRRGGNERGSSGREGDDGRLSHVLPLPV